MAAWLPDDTAEPVSSRIIRNQPSPFRPGMGLEPPYLGGRRDQLARFESYLSEPGVPHNVLVTGLRGVGKTVLLNRYSAVARANGWIVVDREFSEADRDPATFAAVVVGDLLTIARELSASQRLQAAAQAFARAVLDHLGAPTMRYGGAVRSCSGRRAAAPASSDDDLTGALQEGLRALHHRRRPPRPP